MIDQWLAIVDRRTSWDRLSPAHQALVLASGICGLDIRVPHAGGVELAEQARAAGLRVRIHHWAGREYRRGDGTAGVTADDGRVDGRTAAMWCRLYRAEACAINAERDVWRGRSGREHEDAVDYLDAYADAYHAEEAGELHYLGYMHPPVYYPGGEGLPEWLRRRYQMGQAMAYRADYDGIMHVLQRARMAWPDSRLGAWAGVGRWQDADRDGEVDPGEVIGDAEAWRRLIGERACGIEEVTWYVGHGEAWRQLVQGHDLHPPLVALVAQIEADEGGTGRVLA